MRWSIRLGVMVVTVALLLPPAAGDPLGGPSEQAGSAGGGGDPPGGGATQKVISDVPSYIWYNGCGPTSIGMVVGYWDAHGFPNFIPGSNDWNTNQQGIEDAIASAGHIRDYVPTPDRTPTPEDPYHPNDSIADFNYCSRQPDQYGWSYFSNQDDGFMGYSIYCGYVGSTAQNILYGSLWDQFKAAIDDDHPVELLVDTDGNGSTDHFVTGIGYYDDGAGSRSYACYDTWSHPVRWYSYLPVGEAWGVHGGTFFQPVPEPCFLMYVGLLALAVARRKSHAR